MKRKDLLRYILKRKCILVREGGKHSVFYNPLNKRISTIPRHNEIDDYLSKKIIRDLGIRR